jgi:hypothetical protein
MTFRLFPREPGFQKLFIGIARDIVAMSELFKEFSTDFSKAEAYKKRAAEIEHRADRTTHEAITLLNTSFITPFDREDIHFLVHELDDVIDLLEDQVRDVYLYSLTTVPAAVPRFADLILESSHILEKLVEGYLDPPRYTSEMRALKQHLYDLEERADRVFGEAIKDLFSKTKDPIEIIRQKDILEGLEDVMDKYLSVGNTIENIVVKSR